MIPLRSFNVLVAWLITLLIGVWIIATQIEVKNDFSLFLPRGTTISQQLLIDQLRDGPTSRLVLMGIRGDNAGDLAKVSRSFIQVLKASGQFSYVLNGEQILDPIEKRFLFQHRYLLSPQISAGRFAPDALRHALETQLRYMRSAFSPINREQLAADPTNEFMAVINQWSSGAAPEQTFGVWMSRDHKRALLIASTKVPGFDLNGQETVMHTIESAFEQSHHNTKTALEISGPAYFALQARSTISREAAILSTLASVLALALLYFYFRSWRLTFLSTLPVVTAVVVGMLSVGLFFGSIHGITLAFGITMIGVANDYSIHFFSHLRSGEAAQASVKRIWNTLNLGIITTIIGFSSILFSGFEGLAQLGLFAVSGLFAAGMVTRWCLPTVVASFNRLQTARWSAEKISQFLLHLQRYRIWVPLLMIASVFFLTFSPQPIWESDVANLSPLSKEAKQLDATLRHDLGAPEVKELILVRGENQQIVLERLEKLLPVIIQLQQNGAIAGYDVATRYIPSISTQRQRLNALPSAQQLQANLKQALINLPFKPDAFAPFVRDVSATHMLFPLEPQELGQSILGLRIASLLVRDEDYWTGLVSLRGPTQPQIISRTLQSLPNEEVYYLDLKAESNRMVNNFRNEGLMLLSWGAIGIVLALIVGLRSLTQWGRLSWPIVACAIITTAVLHAFGERLSLFHLISLVLVFGLSLDYSLFFNKATSKEDVSVSFHAIIICAATTILAFGCLALSSTPVLKAIGITVGVGTFLSFIFAAMLVPKIKAMTDSNFKVR